MMSLYSVFPISKVEGFIAATKHTITVGIPAEIGTPKERETVKLSHILCTFLQQELLIKLYLNHQL